MLLQGRVADEAHAALAALSNRYLRLELGDVTDLSLAGGLSGLALLHAALDSVFPRAGHGARAERALGHAVGRLARRPIGPGLHTGLAGIGWVLAHLLGGRDGGVDPCLAFDAALARALAPSTWPGSFDLIEGLVGLGVYALERMPHPSAEHLLASIVGHLGATARRRRPGVAWWSDPKWVPARWREEPHPAWNLGVAHGAPGVIALLGRVAGAAVAASTRDQARALLGKAVAWLLAQELPGSRAGACFARAVGPGLPRDPARLAWCCGDPGIAAALLVAARAVGERAWERQALRIGLRAASRPEESSGVACAGLCHGSAGVAHVFHRLYRATGEARFAQASRLWFARALATRAPRRGLAGFRVSQGPAFLSGAAGVALALVAATTDAEADWDRVLLLS